MELQEERLGGPLKDQSLDVEGGRTVRGVEVVETTGTECWALSVVQTTASVFSSSAYVDVGCSVKVGGQTAGSFLKVRFCNVSKILRSPSVTVQGAHQGAWRFMDNQGGEHGQKSDD